MQAPNLSLAYIGLGANLGDPVSQLIAARSVLFGADLVAFGRSSSIYVSSPVGYRNQPDFANCVLELHVTETYRALFNLMKSIELDMGRVRDPNNQNAARSIDLDLLLFDDLVISTSDLTVPHPRMHERLFVLKPLEELDSALALFHSNGKLNDMPSNFEGQELVRLAL